MVLLGAHHIFYVSRLRVKEYALVETFGEELELYNFKSFAVTEFNKTFSV